MAKGLKLFNQGNSIISGMDQGNSYALPPKKSMEFSAEEGKKLKRLYPRELVSMDDVTQSFESAPTVAKSKVVMPPSTTSVAEDSGEGVSKQETPPPASTETPKKKGIFTQATKAAK